MAETDIIATLAGAAVEAWTWWTRFSFPEQFGIGTGTIGLVVVLSSLFSWLHRRKKDKAREAALAEQSAKIDDLMASFKAFVSRVSADAQAAGEPKPDTAAIEQTKASAVAIAKGGADGAAAVKKVLAGDAAGFDDLFALAGAKESAARQVQAEAADKARKTVAFWKEIGQLAYLGHTHKSLAAYERAAALDPNDPVAQNQLGLLYRRLGRLDDAIAAFERVLDTVGADDREWEATALVNLGTVAHTRGDLAAAEDYYKRSLAIEEDLCGKEGMATALGNLGNLAITRGNLAAAEDYCARAFALDEELDRKEGMAASLGNLGLVASTRGAWAAADDYYTRALALAEDLGDKEKQAAALGNRGIAAFTRGDLEKAEVDYTRALALSEELDSKEGMAAALGNLGNLARTRGALATAEDYLTRAFALDEELERKEGMAASLGNLGIVAGMRGDLAAAEGYYLRSLAIEEELDRKEGIATALAYLGNVAEQQGDIALACARWCQALALFRQVGMRPEIEQVSGWMRNAGCPAAD